MSKGQNPNIERPLGKIACRFLYLRWNLTIEEIRTLVGRLIPAPPQIQSSSLSGKAALLGAAVEVFSELYSLGRRFSFRLVMSEAAWDAP